MVYNAAGLVERTMKSVASQSWTNLQHVVVDGASGDDTLRVVEKFSRPALKVFSEKDKGIYDAMNKGLDLAEGDYVLFLNAGDELFSATTIEDIMRSESGADVYYGNTAVVDNNGLVLGDRRLSPPEYLDWKSLRHGMLVSHQSMLVRSSIAVKYDLQYRISSDIDWTIRVLKNARKVVNTHIYISKFLEGGVSTSQRKRGLKERFSIMKKHYGIASTLWDHGFIAMRFVRHLFTKKNFT